MRQPEARASERRLAVGFDLDGVLMRNPFESCVIPRLQDLLATAPALAELEPQAARAEARRLVGLEWRRRMSVGDEVGAYDWDGIYRAVTTELGASESVVAEIDVAAWVRECCGTAGHIAALPGAHELLTKLAAAGARLVVVSNGYAIYQRPVLDALGLLGFFDTIVTPEAVGAAKPTAAIFGAAGHLDFFVGDTLEHDVLGAGRAGIPAIWVKPELPASLTDLSPRQRAEHAALPALVEATLTASPHSAYQAADASNCRPYAVVKHLSEVADVVLDGVRA